MSLRAWAILLLVCLIGFLAVISFISNRKNKQGTAGEDAEFLLGGWKTPTVVLGVSYMASAASAGGFIGDPGMMSTIGWPYFWIALIIVPMTIFSALVMMKKLRKNAEKLGSLTVPEFLGSHYNSTALRLIIAVFCAFFYIFVIVAQVKGAAVLLEKYTGISFNAALILFIGIVVFFLILGGMRSLVWTDFVQMIPIIVMSVVLVVLSLQKVGGFNGLESALAAHNPDMLLVVDNRTTADPFSFSFPAIFGCMLWMFISMGSQPYLCSRFLASKNDSRKTVGTFLITVLVVAFTITLFYVVGLTGRILYPDALPDDVSMTVAVNLLHPAFAAMMMVGMFSAILTTVLSIMLTIGQCVGRDIYTIVFNKNATDRQIVKVTRITIFAAGILVLIFTWVKTPALLSTFLYLGLSGIGTCVGIPLYSAILWKKATSQGAVVAALVGPFLYLALTNLLSFNYWVSCGLGILAAIAVMIIVSLVTYKETDSVPSN